MNKTPLNSCVCGTPGTIWAPLGAQYRAPLVKSEFFFLCIFSISLRRRELSESHSYFTMPGPRAILAKVIFREMFSALRNSVSLRHVTSRFVTVNLFRNKRTPNRYYAPPWVNLSTLFYCIPVYPGQMPVRVDPSLIIFNWLTLT